MSKKKELGRRGADISHQTITNGDLFAAAQRHHQAGNLVSARHLYIKLLQAQPNHPHALHFLGMLEHQLGNSSEAISMIRESIRLMPSVAMAHSNLGKIYSNCGHVDQAIKSFQNALAINPDNLAVITMLMHQLQHACLWEGLDAIAGRVLQSSDKGQSSPFILLAINSTPQQQLRCASEYSRSHYGHFSFTQALPSRDCSGDRKKPINIGYLSSDFYNHATAYLTAELFECHDRGSFKIFGYSFGPDDSSVTRRRIVNAIDIFRDITTNSYQQAAEIIRRDQIDILVDLKGYTTGARPEILSLRPAPIQVNYLGYPGTMGADFIDYIIADDYVVPQEQVRNYSEYIVWLPGCYQINDSKREISRLNKNRDAYGISESGFVFCCFNNSYKINPPTFNVWMRLLQEVSGSQLWLLESNSCVRNNLRKEAERLRVDPDRLVFAPKLPLSEHLARYKLADLSLDTLPVNGHTTTSDALWAGCPVVTCSGETFAARVAGSLLHSVGLPQLVTKSLEEYEAVALRLARDTQHLSAIKARLEDSKQTSTLFNAKLFTKHLEKAYELMWENYQSGQPRQNIQVPQLFD